MDMCIYSKHPMVTSIRFFLSLQLIFLSNFCSLISSQIIIQIACFVILWICLRVFFPNLPKSLSHINFLSDLIEFEEYLKDFLILC